MPPRKAPPTSPTPGNATPKQTPQRKTTTPGGAGNSGNRRNQQEGRGNLGTNPLSPPNWQSSRPGLQSDESWQDYDAFFDGAGAEVANIMIEALPEYANTIRSIAWTYRFDGSGSAQADAFQNAGIWDAFQAKKQSGNGSYRGGGGGGGASTAQQYAQAEATIRNEVRSMGVSFNDESIKSLAKVVVDQKWSADMVTDYIVAGAGDWATVQDGQLTAVANDVRRMAASQLVTISEDTTRDYARRVASGELTQDGINSIILGQAKAQFAWLAPQLDAGMTVRDILLPSRDLIARELEVSADTIDLANPKWQNMLTVKEQNGATRAATNNELVVNARRTPEWQNTKGARDLTTAAIMRLRSMFYGD